MSTIATNGLIWTYACVPQRPTDIAFSISADGAIIRRWIDRENDLKAIARYRDDWDGLGTPAPDGKIVDAARQFLFKLRQQAADSPPFRISLSPNGSVCIEWQSKGFYLEAEFASENQVEWMQVIQGKDTTHWIESLGTEVRSDDWSHASQTAPVAAASVAGL